MAVDVATRRDGDGRATLDVAGPNVILRSVAAAAAAVAVSNSECARSNYRLGLRKRTERRKKILLAGTLAGRLAGWPSLLERELRYLAPIRSTVPVVVAAAGRPRLLLLLPPLHKPYGSRRCRLNHCRHRHRLPPVSVIERTAQKASLQPADGESSPALHTFRRASLRHRETFER